MRNYEKIPNYEKVRYGALLHDLGKFAYRTHLKLKHEKLSEIFTQLLVPEEIAIPLNGLFFKQFTSNIEANSDYENDNKNKNKREEFEFIHDCIKLGDWISSQERHPLIGEDDSLEKRKDVREIPLESIFNRIRIYRHKLDEDYYFYTPCALNLEDESIFPVKGDKSNNEVSFKKLWKPFEEDMEKIKDEYKKIVQERGENYDNRFDIYFEKLLSLLEKYAFFMPSAAYVDKPDVSLYDHSRMCCAIATSLYNILKDKDDRLEICSNLKDVLSASFEEKYENKKKEISEDALKAGKEELFSLIQVDFSGIQQFIYTISSKHASKTLKGRSSFLIILQDIITQKILNELNLNNSNVIYSSGGNVFILSHKIDEEKVNSIRKEINEELFEVFEGKIFASIGYTNLNVLDFQSENISKKWKEVSEATSKYKSRKFSSIISDESNAFFQPKSIYDKQHFPKEVLSCTVCNREIKKDDAFVQDENGEMKKLTETENLNAPKYCSYCKSFIQFTKEFLKNKDLRQLNFKNLKKHFPFIFGENKINIEKYQYKYYFNQTSDFPFKFFPRMLPLDFNHSLLTFEDLAKEAINKDNEGVEKIGVLKMDVDNLGKIFISGLDRDKSERTSEKTLSRMANLSSLISIFFEGYIDEILKRKEFKKSIYLIYSGGDDSFIVGAWNKVLDFAKELYNKFRRYTCYNEDITQSAGFIITDSHYPISKAAQDAEEALDNAKNFSGNMFDKNRITIFGEVFSWNPFVMKETEEFVKCLENKVEKNDDESLFDKISEFEIVYHLKNYLIHLVKDEKIKRGFLQRIKSAVVGFRKPLRDSIKGKEPDVSYIWRLKYHIVRNYNLDKTPEVKNISNLIDMILKSNLKGNNKILNPNILSVAARLAELETRKNQKGDEENGQIQ